jgi:ribosomal protein L13E
MTTKSKVYKKGGKQRCGRGFSREELKRVKLSLKDALRLKIPVDSRRRTVHEENVEVIKTFLESRKAEAKPKRKAKS